jgi:hypothetical protein
MSIIASMSVLLSAQTGPFQKGMAAASKSMSPLQSAMAGLDSGMKGLAKTMLASFAVSKAWDIADKIVQQQKYADAVGISRETLVAYEMAAKKAGLETEQFHRALVMMAKAVESAASGESAAAEAFNTIGVNAAAIRGLAIDKQFEAISKGFQSINSSGKEAAAIADIFGAKAYKMKTMVEMTGEEFEKMAKKSKALGLNITDEDARGIMKAQSAIKAVGTISEGAAQQMLAGTAPAIEKVVNAFNTLWAQGHMAEGFGVAFTVVGEVLAIAAEAVSATLAGLKLAFLSTFVAIMEPFSWFSDTVQAWQDGFKEEIAVTIENLGRFANSGASSLGALEQAGADLVDENGNVIVSLKDKEKALKDAADAAKKAAEEERKYAEEMDRMADQFVGKYMTNLQKLHEEMMDLETAKKGGGFVGRESFYNKAWEDLNARIEQQLSLGEQRVKDIEAAISTAEGAAPEMLPEAAFEDLKAKLFQAFQHGMLGASGPAAQAKYAALLQNAWESTVGEAQKKKQEEDAKKADEQREKDAKYWQDIEDRASSIKDAMATPAEKAAKLFEEARDLMEQGLLDPESYNRYVKKIGKDLEDATKPTTARGAFTEVNFARVSTEALAMQGDRVQQQQLAAQNRTAVATEKIAKKIEGGLPSMAA